MRSLVKFSLSFRHLVLAIAVALIFFGMRQISEMPVDVFPEFAPPRVEIQTISVGLTAEDVEAFVTVPLEVALNGIPGVKQIRSKSVADLSSIQVIFKVGTDVMTARQLVSERLETITQTLPTWVAPPFMIQPLSSTSRVMKIGVTSKEHSTIDLSMTAYWKIRARLLQVPGVANVPIWGEQLHMMQVQVDPVRMVAMDVTLDDIMEATGDSLDVGLLKFTSGGALVGTGGFVETGTQRLQIQNTLPIVTAEDLGRIVIVNRDTGPVLLSDVANLVEDHQPMVGDAIINGGEGLLLIVEKFPWGNTLEVTRGVEDALAELAPGLQGVDIDTKIFRPATFVEISIDNLTEAMLVGAALVIIVLLLFLFEWRVALITVVAIPLSLIAAGTVMALMGASINTMVLAGLVIALGEVVDDAIIYVENIIRRLRQNKAEKLGKGTGTIILDASIEVWGSIVYATLIAVAALLPVFFLDGLSGAFFRPLATAYVLAILASMVVALTVTPAMSLLLLGKLHSERRESPVVRVLQKAYQRVLTSIVRAPQVAFGVVGIVAITALGVTPFLGQALLPNFQERDFLMHWVARPGTSLTEMQRITRRASDELLAIPGVQNFGSHIGQAYLMDEVVGVEFTELWISISPEVDYASTLGAIQETVNGYPGLKRDVQTYLRERIKEVLTGSSESIVVRIFGPELETLRAVAEDVEGAMKNVDGLKDLHVDLQVQVPQVRVEVDLDKARAYGLKPGDVRRAAATWMAGEEVGDIFRDGRAYDVVVWSTPQSRASLNDYRRLLIDTPSGERVELGELANIRIVPAPNSVVRVNATRKLDVGANIAVGGDLGAAVANVKAALATVSFPLGYGVEVLGEGAERKAAANQLVLFSIAAAAVIFALLVTSFRNWTLAALVFCTLPTALVGGLIAALLDGGVVSLGSLVGFLTVFGIAARNGIMMVNHFQHLEEKEGVAFGPELVLQGARERLSPILMTAIATGIALLPLVVAGNAPGNEIEHPMAAVIVGGLVTSTLINLFVVPSLYLKFGRGMIGFLKFTRTDPSTANTPLDPTV